MTGGLRAHTRQHRGAWGYSWCFQALANSERERSMERHVWRRQLGATWLVSELLRWVTLSTEVLTFLPNHQRPSLCYLGVQLMVKTACEVSIEVSIKDWHKLETWALSSLLIYGPTRVRKERRAPSTLFCFCFLFYSDLYSSKFVWTLLPTLMSQ